MSRTEIYYDEPGSSLDALDGKRRRGAGLRLARPRPCAQPEGLGFRRHRRAAQGLQLVGAGGDRRAAGRRAFTSRCSDAELVAMLLPDQHQATVYHEAVEPNLDPGAALLFAHGFNIHFGQIRPHPENDVIMIAPKAPGPLVRRTFEEGSGIPGPPRDRPGRDGSTRTSARTRLREGHRLHARRRDRDDVRRGDRDRPLRRASRPLWRNLAPDPGRVRDARATPVTSPRSRTSSASTS